MTDIDAMLEQARGNAVGYGNKRGLKETADDYLKGVYAMLYEDAEGATVGDRDAWVKRQDDYKAAIDVKAERYGGWEAAQLHMKIVFAQLDKYRTDQSTARYMDKAHT